MQELIEQYEAKGVLTRGCYDVAGFRADADFLFWWVAPTSDELQEVYSAFRRTRLGRACEPVWSAMALHRPAEFNKGHIPAYLAGIDPLKYVCVYPFVRSYEWYLLPDDERRAMLAEHGLMAREYPDVRANTVASFALGDYEWMLAFEADELHRIVDLMRHLRGASARLHTRIEVPFYTGARKSVSELLTAAASGAFDQQEVRRRERRRTALAACVLRRLVPALGSRLVLELEDDHAAGVPVALEHGRGAAAHEEVRAVLLTGRGGERAVVRVPLRVGHVDVADHVGLGHAAMCQALASGTRSVGWKVSETEFMQ